MLFTVVEGVLFCAPRRRASSEERDDPRYGVGACKEVDCPAQVLPGEA
ncbi:hypothetical protein [Sorangium sp. So ce1078]